MPKFRIGRSYGYAGDTEYELIEAETLEEAEKESWQWAIERVDSWAEPYDPDKHDGTF